MKDAELVQRVRQGHTEVYAQLVDRYRDAIYGLAYHHLYNFEDARDVAQEAFVHAFLYLDQLRDPAKFGPWVRRIAINECRMWQRRRHPTEPEEESPSKAVDAEEVALRLSVQQALACLSESSRLTLTLYYINGYSQKEIGEFLEVPVTTVKSRLRDARARLRKELVQMFEETLKEQSLPAGFAGEVCRRVLLMEEDRALASRAEKELSEAGFEVLRAEKGDTLFNDLRQHRPGVLILSHELPGAEGFEALESLKKSAEFGSLPVVFVMAHPDKEDLRRAWDAGADCFLNKPYDAQELARFVSHMLESRGRPT